MSKPIGIIGYQCELTAERLQVEGLICKAFPIENAQDVKTFLDELESFDIFIFSMTPMEYFSYHMCQVGAICASGKQFFLDTSSLLSPFEEFGNPFLSNVQRFVSFPLMKQYLSETC